MSKYYRSGQVDLDELTITTKDNTPTQFDLSRSYVDITLYESLFDKVMSGNVSFVDSSDIVNVYSLGNGETVKLSFKTAGADEGITFEGTVYDITGPAQVSGHASGYTLHFMNSIALESIKTPLFNGYRGKVSDFVSDIYSKLKPDKTLSTLPTKYLDEYVLTGQTPMEAITMFSRSSVGQDGTFGYLFYEDNQQCNFKSVQSLYKQEPVREFFYRDVPSFENVKHSHEEMFDVYQEFAYEDSYKYIEKLKDGVLGCTTMHVGLFDKNMQVTKHTQASWNNTMLGKHINQNVEADHLKAKLRVTYNVQAKQAEPDLEKNTLALLKCVENTFNIGIFGDSTLKAGQTVIAHIPTYASDTFSPDQIDFLTGKFLIGEIKHVITPKMYNQRILLIKDSYEETVL